MAKIGLFFGSNTGNTEYVAYQMKDEFDRIDPTLVDVHNIGTSSPEQLQGYQFLIFGIPTWNTGQLQDDWEFFLPRMQGVDMSGRKIAIFGLGDQNGYGFNFLDAVGPLADTFMECGAELYGLWPSQNYQFEESRATIEDHFLGLGIDQDGQPERTPERLKQWCGQVLREFAIAVPS